MTTHMRPGLRAGLVARMIGASVPLLNVFRRPRPFPYSLDDLRAFAPRSLGAATVAFLDRRQFTFLPKYEVHDVMHTLLGYGTTTTGELRLQAFMWGNRSSSFAGRVLFLIGILTLPELWSPLYSDYKRGRRAHRLANLDIPGLLHEEIDTVRDRFAITPPAVP